MKQITKTLQKQIEYLGWNVEPTYEALFRYMLEVKRRYVLAHPLPHDKWCAAIVILGKPNTQDGKLNAVAVDGTMKTYDDAIKKGVELAVKVFYEGHRKFVKIAFQPDSEKKFNEIDNKLRKDGFDI